MMLGAGIKSSETDIVTHRALVGAEKILRNYQESSKGPKESQQSCLDVYTVNTTMTDYYAYHLAVYFSDL